MSTKPKQSFTAETILTRLAEETFPPETVDLWPALQARLSERNRVSQKKETTMNDQRTKIDWKRLALGIGLALLLAAGLVFATPQGRAWAQSLLAYFSRSGNTLALPTPQPVQWANETLPARTLASTPTAEGQPEFYEYCGSFSEPTCTLAQIQDFVAFPLKGLTGLPQGVAFSGATGGPQGVTLTYRTADRGTVLLLEEQPLQAGETPRIPVAESAEVANVTVGAQPGEYVRGGYTSQAGALTAVWDANLDLQTLRWSDAAVVYTIQVMGQTELPGQALDRAGMLGLAAALARVEDIAQPTAAATLPAAQRLAAAEQQAGFTAVQPAELPEGFTLAEAHVLADQKTICLSYRHTADRQDLAPSLTLAESAGPLSASGPLYASVPLPSADALFPDNLPGGLKRARQEASVPVGGAINGQGLYLTGGLDAAPYCGGQNPDQALLVSTGQLNLIIFARSANTISTAENTLTQQQMVRLAESITGVQNVPTDAPDLERLTDLQQAAALAGFALKQPGKLPEGQALDHIRVQTENGQKTVTVFYSDGSAGFQMVQGPASAQGLDAVKQDHPETFDPVTVHSLPALISQGFWDGQGWKELENGGDGGVTLTWIEAGMQYTISGFNQYPRAVWLTIAESVQ